MSLTTWANARIKKLRYTDIALIKISVAAFTLMAAKLWMPLLSLQWYWYLAVTVLAAFIPYYRIFKE